MLIRLFIWYFTVYKISENNISFPEIEQFLIFRDMLFRLVFLFLRPRVVWMKKFPFNLMKRIADSEKFNKLLQLFAFEEQIIASKKKKKKLYFDCIIIIVEKFIASICVKWAALQLCF